VYTQFIISLGIFHVIKTVVFWSVIFRLIIQIRISHLPIALKLIRSRYTKLFNRCELYGAQGGLSIKILSTKLYHSALEILRWTWQNASSVYWRKSCLKTKQPMTMGLKRLSLYYGTTTLCIVFQTQLPMPIKPLKPPNIGVIVVLKAFQRFMLKLTKRQNLNYWGSPLFEL